MRVTQTLLSQQALNALQSNLIAIGKSHARLATGRQLQEPSDDPAGHAAATRLTARLTAIKQFRTQAEWAQELLNATDTVADGLVSLMSRAQELAVSGANGTLSAAERAAMAGEVDQLLEEAVELANTSHGGRYLLGGFEVATPPLSVTRDAAGQITAATWNPRGVDGAVDVDIDEGSTVQANLGGTQVLGDDTDPTFLPALLVRLRDALAADDQAGVNALLADLGTAESRLTASRSTIGARLRRIDRALDDLDTARLAAEDARSSILDADLGRVAVELSQQEALYQAALRATAGAIQPSLLEFLR